MHKVIVASENPVKINATRRGFEQMFPDLEFTVEGISVESGVNDQPIGRDETLTGAMNRLRQATKQVPDADYWVGIEGGIEIHNEQMEVSAWIVIRDKTGRTGKGQTGTFVLPPAIAEHVRDGKELGTATDIVFSKTNSKQAGGSIGELTGGLIDRTKHYDVGVVFALIPFKNPELFAVDKS
ncbi:non-canonical purine NTP phosphatase [Patescibacteria group bacterium]|nr:MAG: non-canonical purine NTP phosphatase [Patescibacteria group bacterium]